MEQLEEIIEEIKNRIENYEKTILYTEKEKKVSDDLLEEYKKEFRKVIKMLKNSEQFMLNFVNKLKEQNAKD